MAIELPTWNAITAGQEIGSDVAFALCLDGVVQQVVFVNIPTASLLVENPTIVMCSPTAAAGMTLEEATAGM